MKLIILLSIFQINYLIQNSTQTEVAKVSGSSDSSQSDQSEDSKVQNPQQNPQNNQQPENPISSNSKSTEPTDPQQNQCPNGGLKECLINEDCKNPNRTKCVLGICKALSCYDNDKNYSWHCLYQGIGNKCNENNECFYECQIGETFEANNLENYGCQPIDCSTTPCPTNSFCLSNQQCSHQKCNDSHLDVSQDCMDQKLGNKCVNNDCQKICVWWQQYNDAECDGCSPLECTTSSCPKSSDDKLSYCLANKKCSDLQCNDSHLEFSQDCLNQSAGNKCNNNVCETTCQSWEILDKDSTTGCSQKSCDDNNICPTGTFCLSTNKCFDKKCNDSHLKISQDCLKLKIGNLCKDNVCSYQCEDFEEFDQNSMTGCSPKDCSDSKTCPPTTFCHANDQCSDLECNDSHLKYSEDCKTQDLANKCTDNKCSSTCLFWEEFDKAYPSGCKPKECGTGCPTSSDNKSYCHSDKLCSNLQCDDMDLTVSLDCFNQSLGNKCIDNKCSNTCQWWEELNKDYPNGCKPKDCGTGCPTSGDNKSYCHADNLCSNLECDDQNLIVSLDCMAQDKGNKCTNNKCSEVCLWWQEYDNTYPNGCKPKDCGTGCPTSADSKESYCHSDNKCSDIQCDDQVLTVSLDCMKQDKGNKCSATNQCITECQWWEEFDNTYPSGCKPRQCGTGCPISADSKESYCHANKLCSDLECDDQILIVSQDCMSQTKGNKCIDNKCTKQCANWEQYSETSPTGCIDQDCATTSCNTNAFCLSNKKCSGQQCEDIHNEVSYDCLSQQAGNKCQYNAITEKNECNCNCPDTECSSNNYTCEKCSIDIPCKNNKFCFHGRCEEWECDFDHKCSDNKLCVNEKCVDPECTVDTNCEDDEICQGGICVINPNQCTGCTLEEFCQNIDGSNQCATKNCFDSSNGTKLPSKCGSLTNESQKQCFEGQCLPQCTKTSDCGDVNYLCLKIDGAQANCVRKCTNDDGTNLITKDKCTKSAAQLCTFKDSGLNHIYKLDGQDCRLFKTYTELF